MHNTFVAVYQTIHCTCIEWCLYTIIGTHWFLYPPGFCLTQVVGLGTPIVSLIFLQALCVCHCLCTLIKLRLQQIVLLKLKHFQSKPDASCPPGADLHTPVHAFLSTSWAITPLLNFFVLCNSTKRIAFIIFAMELTRAGFLSLQAENDWEMENRKPGVAWSRVITEWFERGAEIAVPLCSYVCVRVCVFSNAAHKTTATFSPKAPTHRADFGRR